MAIHSEIGDSQSVTSAWTNNQSVTSAWTLDPKPYLDEKVCFANYSENKNNLGTKFCNFLRQPNRKLVTNFQLNRSGSFRVYRQIQKSQTHPHTHTHTDRQTKQRGVLTCHGPNLVVNHSVGIRNRQSSLWSAIVSSK